MAEFDLPHEPLVSLTFMNVALSLGRRHRRYDELVFHAERAGMTSAASQFKKLRDSSEWNGWEHYSMLRQWHGTASEAGWSHSVWSPA